MSKPQAKFRQVREDRGFSQEGLEDLTGVSQAVISSLDLGKVPLSVCLALRLARELGTTVEDLFGEAAAELPPREKRTRVHTTACERGGCAGGTASGASR